MLKNRKNILILLVVVFLFLLVFDITFAQVKLDNPLGVNDPRIVIGNIIKAALGIVGSLALAVFIYGGFTWVISAGNDDKIKKGKDMIVWATIGLAVIFTSYALVTFVIGAVAGSGGGVADQGLQADQELPSKQ